MKECRIIHINDGKPTELYNEDHYFSEYFPRMQIEIDSYLNEGYEVRQVMPHVTPAIQGDGIYSFYQTGYSFYLEREIEPEEYQKTYEDFLNAAFEQIMRKEEETPEAEKRSEEEERESFLSKYRDKIPLATLEYAGDDCEETD